MEKDVLTHYQAITGWFDRTRTKTLMEKPWLDQALAAAPGARVLDIGCGAGEPVAAYLHAQGCTITGIDGAPAMIDLCRQRLPQHEWIAGDMRGLNLDRRFDLIVAWHSLFHLPPADQRAMFGVFARHANKDAVLLMTTGPAAGEMWSEMDERPFYHASLHAQEYRDLAAASGFDVLAHTLGDANCGNATVWLLRKTIS